MATSILQGTKKILGIAEADTSFDLDIITHINSAFFTLTQLGVGPAEGFMIMDGEATWESFVGSDLLLNPVKSLIFLKVKMLFDPPGVGHLVTSMEKQIEQMEWRLAAQAEAASVTATADASDITVWEINENEPFPVEAEEGDVGFDPNTGNVWRVG